MTDPVTYTNLTSHIHQRTYRVETQFKLRVQKMYFENNSTTTLRQTLVKANEDNYVIQLDVLGFTQTADDELNKLFEDINKVTDKLLIRTDRYGSIESVINREEVLERWRQMRPGLLHQHRAKPNAQEVFNGFEKILATPGKIEETIRNKGAHGLLFAGIYRRPLGGNYKSHKVIRQYFSHIDLPLDLEYQVTSKTMGVKQQGSPLDAGVQISEKDIFEIQSVSAGIAASEFNRDEFNLLIKNMADNIRAKTDIDFICGETYRLEQETGWLLRASQVLRTEVPGIYMIEMRNQLTTLK